MANPEHVEIVMEGADAIAEWREMNPNEMLDLEGADLRHAELVEADLSRARLARADLSELKLFGTDLREANLRGAKFWYSTLEVADLRRADLGEVTLAGTQLVSTDLRGAVLSSAQISGAVFGDSDLTSAKGLSSIRHASPSVIDESTLRKSWPLPDVFLRGCGLSDELIDFARATYGKAIEFYSCFISYSSKDDEFARRLHADLQDNGVRCWFAPEDLRIGDKFRSRIDEAIRLHDKLLLILSEDSVNSTWVEDEVESALEKERKAKERGEERTVLFPIRLDSAVMETDAAWAASIRRTRHIGDFCSWKDHDAYQNAFERLLRDLKAGAKQGGNGKS